jgi:hypothetical protein
MEVEYALTEDDLVAFNQHLYTQPPARAARRYTWFFVGASLLAFATLLTVLVFELLPRRETFLLLVGLSAAFYYGATNLYGLLWWRRSVRKSVRKLLKEGSDPFVFAKRRVRISVQGMSEVNEFGTKVDMPWITIRRIETAPTHAFVYPNATEVHVIPKSAFATEDDFRAFVDTAIRLHSQAGLQKFEPSATASEMVIEGESTIQPGHTNAAPPSG